MRIDPPSHPEPAAAFDTYVVNEDAQLLLLRRSFSRRPAPGVWTTALHGHTDGDAVASARDLAQTVLGISLQDVTVVLAATSLQSPSCPEGPEPGGILLARTSRRVVTADPRHFDEAEWVRWDSRGTAGPDTLMHPAVLDALTPG